MPLGFVMEGGDVEVMEKEVSAGGTFFREPGGATVYSLLLSESSKLPLVSVQESNHA